ncbi:MAG: aromatic-ring-hydroxylating dioxygenase subunit beta [Rhodospirillaceae bacterium]|nr:aromatic-ring-hydroxylating dioxygenase subunit beta [Rhodospirillaceae bacterium]
MASPMNHDPSKTSHYVDAGFYEKLIADFGGWQSDAAEQSDVGLRDSCRRFLEKEARFLDQGRNAEWLGLFAPECLYWVPASLDGGDPRREVAVSFDDRRRMEDRVFRLDTDHAWSQQPVSRTARLVSNVSVFSSEEADVFMVRSNFLTTEFQAGDKRIYTGWYGHQLRRLENSNGESWQILVKQVNLIDCDQNLRNPSIVL